MKYTPRLPHSNVNVSSRSPIGEFLILTSFVLGSLVLLFFILGWIVNFLADRVPFELEKKMAAPFLKMVPAQERALNKEVQTLLESLQNKCVQLPYSFQVHLSENDTANALALPGGHILIYSSLLEKIQSENELIFVLAHEIGHFKHRDHLKRLGRGLTLGLLSAFLFGGESSVDSLLVDLLHLTELRHSRQQEMAADQFALKALFCYYGHAGGATDFFRNLETEQNALPLTSLSSTHPEHQERIHVLQLLIESRQYPVNSLKPLNLAAF